MEELKIKFLLLHCLNMAAISQISCFPVLLNKIQAAIPAYKSWLSSVRAHPGLYAWEGVQHFQNNWNPDSTDPASMFDSCFYSEQNRKLWQGENWEPRRIMTEFWKFDPLAVKWMFDDLFNETKSVDGRIGRFLFGCDSVLRDYKKAKPTSIENNHYHGDYRMISVYLSFRYPDMYAPYDFDTFKKVLTVLGARDLPEQDDLPRYFKVLKTLMTFLERDPQVEELINRHLHPKKHFRGKTMLAASDFCRFITE